MIRYQDLESSIEELHKLSYSSPQKTALEGWSSGGLLVGVVATRRPDLIKLAIAGNGIQDLERKDLLDNHFGRGWAHEYGDHGSEEEIQYLRSHSPLVSAQSPRGYPSFLIVAGGRDFRVNPSHSFKLTAALQDNQLANNPILMLHVPELGHWPNSPRYSGVRGLHTLATIWRVIFNELGMNSDSP